MDQRKISENEIREIVRNEFAFEPAARAAALLYARGVTAAELSTIHQIPDPWRVKVVNELRDIDRFRASRQ